MTDDKSGNGDGIGELNIDRRTILRGVGAASVSIAFGAGTAAGQGREGRGNPQEDCDCPEGTTKAKYEFVIERDEDGNITDCYFEFEEGEDLVEIVDWTSKDGEECEPIELEYDAENVIARICAFGGTDNIQTTVERRAAESTFGDDSDEVLTNPGGQRAAISNITFCVGDDGTFQEFAGSQVDLIYGDVIGDFDTDNGVTYNDQERLLQYVNCDKGTLDVVDVNDGAYDQCNVVVTQDITLDLGAGTATATLDPGNCAASDFALVSYGDTNCSFGDGSEQVLVDSDRGAANGDGTYTYTVDLPDLSNTTL